MEGLQTCACIPSTRMCQHNEQRDQVQGCQGLSGFSFHFFSLCWWYQVSLKRNYHLNKTKENNWTTGFHQTTFYLVLCCHHGDSKGARNIYCLCACVRACVSACMCYLPVNRTLIALALQLVDFHSKENFGINKDGTFKVCYYLWISIGKKSH